MVVDFFILEIRQRLSYLIFSLLASIIVVFMRSKPFFYFFVFSFISDSTFSIDLFSYTGLSTLFACNVWISIFVSTLALLPVVCLHVYIFMAPSFYSDEAKFFKIVCYLFVLLVVFSFWFCFRFFLPNLWSFFYFFNSSYSTGFVHLQFIPDVTDLLSFCFYACCWLVLFFQFPFIFMLINIYNPYFIKIILQRKFIYFFFAVLGGFISPPDILSLVILIVFFSVFFEFCIFIFCIFWKSSNFIFDKEKEYYEAN